MYTLKHFQFSCRASMYMDLQASQHEYTNTSPEYSELNTTCTRQGIVKHKTIIKPYFFFKAKCTYCIILLLAVVPVWLFEQSKFAYFGRYNGR